MTPAAGPASAFDGLVGRGREMTHLSRLVDDTRDGVGSVSVVLGEAGIGKTRLLREAARLAIDRGVAVAWGHGWADEGAPTLWPWAQILRSACADAGGPGARSFDVGPGAGLLLDAIPDLVPHLEAGHGPPAPAEHADFYLRDAVSRLLRHLSEGRPLLVVVDDLHWSDQASIRLAVHLSREIGSSPGCLSLVASTRPDDAVTEFPSTAMTVVVEPLSETECAEMAQLGFGVELDPGEQEALHVVTGGVPFRIDTALRHALADGTSSPSGVVSPALDPACRHLLGVASVVGRCFRPAVVAELVDRSTDEVLRILEPAIRAGTVTEIEPVSTFLGPGPKAPSGLLEFRHALIAEEVHDLLPERARAELHLACASLAAERWEQGDAVSERARHLLAALPHGDHELAWRAAQAAAEAAGQRHAHDDAAEWYRRALEACADEDEHRCELLLAHGTALLHGSGVGEAAAVFEEAGRLAGRLGSNRLRLRSLVGVAEARYRAPGLDLDDRSRTLLARAAEEFTGDPRLQCAAAEQLARLETFLGDTARAVDYAERARAIAVGDGDAVAATLASRAMRWAAVGPVSLAAKSEASSALLLSESELHPEDRWSAHQWMMLDAMEAGDRTGMDAELDACRRVAHQLREPFITSLTSVWNAGVATMQGRFGDAEACIGDALALMEQAGVDPAGVYAQMAVVARDRGDLDGLDELIVAVATAVPETSTTYRAALALVYAEQGRSDVARAEIDRLAAGGFQRVPRNGIWLTALALCAEACSVLDYAETAAEILPLLEPFQDRSVVSGGGPYLYLGAVSHHLGSLATTVGDPDRALAFLDDAARIHERMGAMGWIARTQFERGRALVQRGGVDRDAGIRLLHEASTVAADLGMAKLADRAQALGETHSSRYVFMAHQNHWSIQFTGAAFSLPDSKGLRCLHHLIRHRPTSVPAGDLVESVLGDPPTTPDKARVNVTRQIRATIRHIENHDQALARHLRTAVHTGYDCRYDPALAAIDWHLG